MSYLRFNHVFFGLMALACVSAFVLPEKAGGRVQGIFQGIFTPVSSPSHRIGGWVRGKLVGVSVRDNGSPDNPRSRDQILTENTQLRVAIANLRGQLNHLIEREEGLKGLGDVRPLCAAFPVVGGDSSHRDSLQLGGSSFNNLRDEMPVLYLGGIIGRLTNVGVGGARVVLLTDVQSKVEVAFARLIKKPDDSVESRLIPTEPVILTGMGDGVMTGRITEKQKSESGLQKNDSVILSDRKWPAILNGYRIGYVESITPMRAPGFFQITVRPDQNLMELREVMVMNKEK